MRLSEILGLIFCWHSSHKDQFQISIEFEGIFQWCNFKRPTRSTTPKIFIWGNIFWWVWEKVYAGIFFDFTFLCTIWTCLVKEIVGIKSEVIFEKYLGSWKILGCQTKELEHISQFLHNSRQQHFRCLANFMRKLFWNSWCGGSLKNRKNINHCCCSEFGVGLMCLCLCQNFWEQKCL